MAKIGFSVLPNTGGMNACLKQELDWCKPGPESNNDMIFPGSGLRRNNGRESCTKC